MADAQAQRLQQIAGALDSFNQQPLPLAAAGLLKTLGYSSDKSIDLGSRPADFVAKLRQFSQTPSAFDDVRAEVAQWHSAHFLFQLTNDEIPSLMLGQRSFSTAASVHAQQLESFVFLAIALNSEDWSRSALARITRELNRAFPMPAIVVFRHGSRLSIAVIDRRAHKRDAARDVMTDRISIIKDIRFSQPHAAHLRILAALAADTLSESAKRPSNFRELYDAWLNALSVQELNKKFYTELAHWYFWARTQVQFPPAAPKDDEGFQSIAVIRLLTRLIFVWFIKEKGLVPERLFDAQALSSFLKESPLEPDGHGYYQAILQNLFFATLNVELGDDEHGRARRRWADTKAVSEHYLVPNIYRFSEQFNNPNQALDELFGAVPFLNGGLFECLDRELTEPDLKRDPTQRKFATEERARTKTYLVLRADGFSRRAESQARVPNRVFFGSTQADLSSALGDSKRSRDIEVKGLLDIFANYKFTVDENTPVEEEVALDPELLGKVFENLLASYNKDTKTSARKQSGSFYTPRVVVDYMVDEALVVAFSNAFASTASTPAPDRRATTVNAVLDLGPGGGDLDLDVPATLASDEGDVTPAPARDDSMTTRLRHLLGYREEAHRFSAPEAETLISAIEQLKVLDPACGSGAYPMGVLAKLVHVLRKLDPDNRLWRARNRAGLEKQLLIAKNETPDPAARAQRVDDAEAALRKFDATFDANQADYTRKLFLIEKCIHGVDIQPIAVQIAKLRFFIALIVEQKKREGLDNFGLTSLPNLETKIVAADSLLPIPRQDKQKSLLDDPRIAEVEEALREASAGYFSARTRRTKVARRERIQQLHDRLCELLQENSLVTGADAQRMAAYDPFDQNAHAGFFDVEWMFGMHRDARHGEGVFDIVIGNPPYVRHEELADYKPQFKKLYECASGTADLYVYFYERSMQLLKPQGALSFITSNKWYRSGYGKALRTYMRSHAKLMSIIDFGDEAVFTALAYPTIVVAQKRESPVMSQRETNEVLALNWSKDQSIDQFPLVFAYEAFEVSQADLKPEGWQLERPVKRQLLQRMRLAGLPLGKYCDEHFYYGIKTGLNEAFVIDSEQRAQLIAEDPKSAEIIKPFVRGRDVKRWNVAQQGLWIVFARHGIDIKQFPAIHSYLKHFKKRLMPRPDSWDESRQGTWPGRKAGSYKWFEIQDNVAYWEYFESPKIVYPDIYLHQSFSWDTQGLYPANTCYFIPTDEKWLCGLLNTPAIEWFYEQIANRIQGGYLRAFSDRMQTVPIPPASLAQQTIIEALVTAVIEIDDPKVEQLINGLVYELFFPNDLHTAGIRLFDACEREHIARLATLEGAKLQTEAEALAERIFSNSHPIYAMLFDLQALDVVRLIEARD